MKVSKKKRASKPAESSVGKLTAIDLSFQCEPVRENDCVIEIVESDRLNRLYRPFRKDGKVICAFNDWTEFERREISDAVFNQTFADCLK